AGRYELALSPLSALQLVAPTGGGATEIRMTYSGAVASAASIVQLRAGEETAARLVQDLGTEGKGAAAFAVSPRSSDTGSQASTSGSSSSPRRVSTIQGQITDPNGRPIKGALVRVVTDGFIRVVDSDDDGRYAISGLATGVVEVLAAKSGFIQT